MKNKKDLYFEQLKKIVDDTHNNCKTLVDYNSRRFDLPENISLIKSSLEIKEAFSGFLNLVEGNFSRCEKRLDYYLDKFKVSNKEYFKIRDDIIEYMYKCKNEIEDYLFERQNKALENYARF